MRQTSQILVCDRCGQIAEEAKTRGVPDPNWNHGWGRISVVGTRNEMVIGGDGMDFSYAKDICPDCVNEVYEWFVKARPEEKIYDVQSLRPVSDNE